MSHEMTPDFREGLIEAYGEFKSMIQAQRADPSNTAEVTAAFDTLLRTIEIDSQELERSADDAQ